MANRAGIELKNLQSNKGYEKNKNDKERQFEIMEEATKFYEESLKHNSEALIYLKDRGISDISIKKWRLGFAKEEWRNLHDALLKKGFSKEEMLKTGLIKKVPNENKYYDTFRNRIMFPISDSAGRVVAFSGRLLESKPKESQNAPKYLNSPETDLFRKSEILYGLHLAKHSIRKFDYTVLVEGQMDLVMSHQASTTNTVASSGTAISITHLEKIRRLSNRVIFAFDSDNAGLGATRRAAEIALLLEMETKVATLEDGEDPASTIKKNPDLWRDALKKASHFTDFVLEKAIAGREGHSLTREVIKNVLPLVPLIKSEVERSQFIKKIALKMGVTEREVLEDVNKLKVAIKDPGDQEIENKKNKTLEDLMFEAEKYGYKIDTQKISQDVAKREQIKSLKSNLQKIASQMDDKNLNSKDEKEMKKEFGEIQKKIKELESEN